MNKVILIGNLTRDPEIRYSQSAEPVAIARYTLAVNRARKREGEPDADFVNCVSFGRQAEFMEKYFKKGMKAAVTGRLNVYTYEDNQGQRRWGTDVIVEEVEFTESRGAYEARIANQGQGGGYQAQGQGGGQARYDNMAEQYTPPSGPPAGSQAPNSNPAVPDGFAAITESIDDDDLPF